MFWLGFAIGCMIGASFGLVTFALLRANRDDGLDFARGLGPRPEHVPSRSIDWGEEP